MSVSRREFVQAGGAALVGLAAAPVLDRARGPRVRTLVCLFQRGAVDGLSMVVPHRDDAYYRARPHIAIPRRDVIDLDGYFGLHPALAPLRTLWDRGSLTVVHAVGSPHATRSHGEGQRHLETGILGARAADSWANRFCAATPAAGAPPLGGVAVGPVLPRVLTGPAPALAIDALQPGDGPSRRSSGGAGYPRGPLGRALFAVARLIESEAGVEIAVVESDGWDTHIDQGASGGRLADRFNELGRALAAFDRDLGQRMADVVVLTLSEFGRTVRENGCGGTDHGRATAMLAIGGPVAGGQVLGRWPGLDSTAQVDDGSLAVTTDFRDVIAEVLARHLGARDLGPVFPGHEVSPSRCPGVIRG